MSISTALPSMTAAPSNVKKREIRKGGDIRKNWESNNIQLQAFGQELFCCAGGSRFYG